MGCYQEGLSRVKVSRGGQDHLRNPLLKIKKNHESSDKLTCMVLFLKVEQKLILDVQ